MSYKQLVRSVGHINTHMVGEYVTGQGQLTFAQLVYCLFGGNKYRLEKHSSINSLCLKLKYVVDED